MKMTQEEKAKAYDEAVKVIKDNLDALNEIIETGAGVVNIQSIKNCFYRAFPELKESEDEKTMKALINFLKSPFVTENITDEKVTPWLDWLEKQGEQKEYTFKSLPRLLDMIESTDRAKAYCQKLIDSLLKEGYATDAKIVGECLKKMNGEDVPMATMDENQGEQKSVDKIEDTPTLPFDPEPLTEFERAFQGMCSEKNRPFAKDCCKVLLELARKQIKEETDNKKQNEYDNTLQAIIYTVKNSGYKYCIGVSNEEMIAWLEKQGKQIDSGEISDGYHTFNELYYYRMLYNAAFFNMLPKELVHKSKRHNDGEECFGGGWFIVMANLPTGQISNHYELKDWDLFQIPEKEVADEWDGHTPQEAAERLHNYLLEKQSEQKSQRMISAEALE